VIDVRHDAAAGRFSAVVEGQEAYLLYHAAGPETLDFESTFVPVPLRQRGIASALVRQALDYARARRAGVVPSCWFVRRFVERHPEYRDLVAQS
jgi:uncharacterized protein